MIQDWGQLAMSIKNYQMKQQQLDIYITEFKQGIVLIGNNLSDHQKFMENYRKNLHDRKKMAYVNFAKVVDIRSLAECFIEQYSQLFEEVPVYYDPSDELGLLNFSVELFSKIDDQEHTIIWLDNFTEVRKWKDADYVYRILRGTFQHQENIVHVFTSHNIKEVHSIFSNYNNPFFHFAAYIKVDD